MIEVVEFIREIFQQETDFIPLHAPQFKGNEKKYLLDCIESTFVSSVGEYVNKFERKIEEITRAKYAIATTNGTSALHVSLILAGVKAEDEVITQAISFVATCNAIKYANATPHFVDIDKDSLSLSPSVLEEYLESISYQKGGYCINRSTGKRIKACIPMHTFGLPGRIVELKKVCLKFNLILIEDAAESLGSYCIGKHTGTFGDLGVFSFNGNKIATCGGGGVIVTNNEDLAKKAKHLTTTAKVPHQWEYIHDEIGFNYRLPNLNAALAFAQLEQLSSFVQSKRELAQQYQAFFEKNNIEVCKELSNTESNYWLNAIVLKNRKERDEFLKFTNGEGVMTRPIWESLNKLKMYENSPKSDLSNSEYVIDRVVNIPSSVR